MACGNGFPTCRKRNSKNYFCGDWINVTIGIIEKGYPGSSKDTILAKLRWAKLAGGSEKQFTDALRVYEVQFGKLDLGYLEQWVKKLKIESLWRRLIDEAEVT